MARAADTLYLYNWNNYISDDTVQRFEAHCRCRLKQDYYSDNEEMLAKLEAGAVGYDVLVPTGNAVESLIRRKALRAIDKAQLPNFRNVKGEFLDTWFDPGNRYSVPYATSVTLLGFNLGKMRELGLPTDSWALIFDPHILSKIKGRVTVLNSQRELMQPGRRAGYVPPGRRNSMHGCRSWWSRRRRGRGVPERFGCRSRPRSDGWQRSDAARVAKPASRLRLSPPLP